MKFKATHLLLATGAELRKVESCHCNVECRGINFVKPNDILWTYFPEEVVEIKQVTKVNISIKKKMIEAF